MKKRHLILAILAVILVLSVSIGPTIAYFTTYADGNGGYVIHLGHRSDIYEVVGDTKQVQIQNLADTNDDVGKFPLFIRAKIYAGTDCIVDVDLAKSQNWFDGGDGYYYYSNPIYAALKHDPPAAGDASTTSKLIISVKADPDADIKPGDVIDVLVTYQSVPAVFDNDGNPLLTKAWANQEAITDING